MSDFSVAAGSTTRARSWLIIAARCLTLALTVCLLPQGADATCSWILWTETKEVLGPKDIAPSSAYETRQECERASTLSLQHAPSMKSEHVDVQVVGASIFLTNRLLGKLTTMSFTCFPDTIDPRGPKGDAR